MSQENDRSKPADYTLTRMRKFLLEHSWVILLISGSLAVLLVIAHQLSVMASWDVFGFSFDDSWIHVQYARTIFEGHPWEYSEGIPSTGSSAPLWSVVLTPIFLFGFERTTVVTSVLVISGILFGVDTFLVGILLEGYVDDWKAGLLGQVVFVLVPRNVGLMLSGMETPLAMLFLLLTLILLPKSDWKCDPILGVLAGLAYLCRPEFVLIAALCFPLRFVYILYKRDRSLKRLVSLLSMFALAILTVAPWVLHCLNVTGLPLPDSYYSKMRWGVSPDAISLWNHFWFRVWLPSEPYLVLGFIGAILLAVKGRPYEVALIGGMTALYRLTMPGMALLFAARYLVPLFDLLSIAFVAGISILLNWIIAKGIPAGNIKPYEKKMLVIIPLILLFAPSLPSYDYHVQIHANQTSNIQEMQVTLSLWIHENVPANATIATYDVGAIGYFAEGTVIDLYGLVTPEVLHNRTTVREEVTYLREINCSYVMFYVQWFVALRFEIVRQNGTVNELVRAHLDNNVVCGTDDMAVYRIVWS